MKRKVLKVIYVILILIMIKLIYNTILNNIFIDKYRNGDYSQTETKLLTYVNFPESYVARYNYGNIFYQNGEYKKAIEEYEKALQGIVPKYKECSIRINYALAICKTVEVDENDEQSIKNAIEKYETAIDVLTENGCGNKEDNNGHSQNAEKLKKDIQKEIDRLKKMRKEEDDSESEEKEEQQEKQDEAQTVEAKIQEIKEEAIEKQREKENLYKNFNKTFNRKSKNW